MKKNVLLFAILANLFFSGCNKKPEYTDVDNALNYLWDAAYASQDKELNVFCGSSEKFIKFSAEINKIPTPSRNFLMIGFFENGLMTKGLWLEEANGTWMSENDQWRSNQEANNLEPLNDSQIDLIKYAYSTFD